jgi:AhpD family alkylhydroperoxidase
MSTFPIPTIDTVEPSARPLFEAIKKQLGKVPNLYATIGHSPNTLKAYLDFQAALAKGAFNNREIQAVFLAVSEVNKCQYCLSAHTALAKMAGFSEEETYQLRLASITDERLGVITRLTRSLVLRRGEAEPSLVEKFFAAGFNRAALIELVALVADKTFANYVNNLIHTPIDFPMAKELDAIAA